MEAVIQREPALLKPPGHHGHDHGFFHRDNPDHSRKDQKKDKKKKKKDDKKDDKDQKRNSNRHRSAWFRRTANGDGDDTDTKIEDEENKVRSDATFKTPPQISASDTKHGQHPKQTSRSPSTKESEKPYSIPPPISSDHEDFTFSVTKSLELAQKRIQFGGLEPMHQARRHESSKTSSFSNTPTSPASLSKMLRANSFRNKFSKASNSPASEKDFDFETSHIHTDRRKLNAKELKLELSRGYNEIDCEMKRSGSFRRPTSALSRESSVKHKRKLSEKMEGQVILEDVQEGKQGSKNPSTPVRASVAHSLSTYLGSLGLHTPPSSSKKQHEERAKEAHELKKQSIRHLTPPHTPSRTYHTTLIPIPQASDNGTPEPDWSSVEKPNKAHHDNPTSTSASTVQYSEGNTQDHTIPSSTESPSQNLAISAPHITDESSCLEDGLFENPRQLPQLPFPSQYSSGHIQKHTPEMSPSTHTDIGTYKSTNVSYDIRSMVSPVVAIANAFGLPATISVNQPEWERPTSNVDSVISSTDRLSNADNHGLSHRTSLRVKTVINSLPRRAFSKSSSDQRSSKNNPYLQEHIKYNTSSSLDHRTPNEDGPSSTFSEDSSVENLQTINTPTSANGPVSAFDDDSSDDDYFGDLIQLSGLGARNLRRKKASSRRFSRDSIPTTPDRPFSRLSFSSKQDRLDSPKETEHGQISTENFIPIHQLPIPEEAQLSTSAGTFNTPSFGNLRHIRDNEVYHLKDGDGYDHLVLEQEDGRNVVVAGTFDCLLSELCTAFETGDDDGFIDVFLRASLLFTTPMDILRGLAIKFRHGNSRAQERILLALDRWLRILPEDIIETETTRETFLMFVGEISCWGQHNLATRLLRTYSHMKEKLQFYSRTVEETKRVSSIDELPATVLFSEHLKPFFGDASIIMEVAQYLTSVDLVLFRDASHTRTMSLWWISQSAEEQESWTWESEIPYADSISSSPVAERVDRLLRRSANFKFWIQHEILEMRRTKDRADLISSLIHLALILREQGNFQSCLTILDALAADIVINLEKTWDFVSIEKIREFSELRSMLDPKNYISTFSKLKDFAIPYFPFFIKTITTLLNRSTNASFRYSNASKIHVDALIETTLNRPSTASSGEKPNRLPSTLVDFKKYRSFVKEIAIFRAMAKYPPYSVCRVDRNCFAFRNLEMGRMAFPRDASSAGGSARTRSRSGSAVSLQEDDVEAASNNQISEIIEGRINTVLAPVLRSSVPGGKNREQLLLDAITSLNRCAKGESWLEVDAGNDDISA